MAHLTHTCRCGKTIHWPKTAKIGDHWRCNRCGCVHLLVDHGGKPGRIQSSLKPWETSKQDTTYRDDQYSYTTRDLPLRPNKPRDTRRRESLESMLEGIERRTQAKKEEQQIAARILKQKVVLWIIIIAVVFISILIFRIAA
jgi:hypothetical protein